MENNVQTYTTLTFLNAEEDKKQLTHSARRRSYSPSSKMNDAQ